MDCRIKKSEEIGMIKVNKVRLLLLSIILLAAKARAEIPFGDLLKAMTADKKNIVAEIPEINALLKVKTIQEAQSLLQQKTLQADNMIERRSSVNSNQVLDLVKQRNLTIIIVPGVLGEFIETRAMEEVFARPSAFKTQWNNIVAKAGATDERFDLQAMQPQKQSLSELVNAASIDDSNGRPLVKVVILKTFLGSGESIGANADKAAVFNRRVQKYIDLTGDQNIVLLGYSRGTPLALEMVAQAQAKNLPYLSRVKALVSYAGVVSGSALADVTADPTSESGAMLKAALKLFNDLQMADSIWDRPAKRAHNTQAVAEFVYAVAKNQKFDPNAFLANARGGDFKTVAALIMKVCEELGLDSLWDFNGHVNRVKFFISEILKAVVELRSDNRMQWWKTHTLPKHITYASLTASMVDPDAGAFDKAVYSAHEGYSDSLDDQSLIANMRQYKQITGVALNDSQVAVHQSLFLPEVIAQLNPANSGLTIKPLGLLQTHHWGVSLQVVNKMKDGRLNPFPREKVLLSLAAYLNQ